MTRYGENGNMAPSKPHVSRDSPPTIRRARPAEAAALTELAIRAKGHWGYDAAFMAACRDELTVTPAEIAATPVFVHDGRDGIAGYYGLLARDDGVAELDDLFVDPTAMGEGVGRRLWNHAVAQATVLGCSHLVIQSDPFAEGFYRAMGAQRIGESESGSVPGRMLPLLTFTLPTE